MRVRKSIKDEQWKKLEPLLLGLLATQVVADKGYDTDTLVIDWRERGMEPVIPPRRNRLEQRDYDRHVYKDRNLVTLIVNRP